MSAARLDAREAARRISDGSLDSETLVAACLERIAAREPVVGAWAHCDPRAALLEARDRDRERRERREGSAPLGPLHGVPVGVKDMIDTADLPTGYGSPIYRGHRPKADAAVVAHARRAGAVVLGKTVTTEFASVSPAATRNPLDPAHTPGGSSSGSAAAVADAMVPLAIGTQTGGSVIRPAAFCGVVGFKPSFGRINRAGLKFSAESLDTIGLFARSVGDVTLLDDALLGPHRAAVRPAVTRLRFGLHRTSRWARAEPSARAALERAARLLEDSGATVVEHAFDDAFDGLNDAQLTIMNYEAARATLWEYRAHRGLLTPAFSARLEEGFAIDPEAYRRACAAAADCRARHAVAFDGVDALLTPSAVGEAPRGLQSTGDSVFNRIWTLLGVPAIHLPGGLGAGGLPVGVQLVGRFGEDAALLGTASRVEAVLGRAEVPV